MQIRPPFSIPNPFEASRIGFRALKVTLIGEIVIKTQNLVDATDNAWSYDWKDTPTGADSLAEFAGRACYQSWDRPNPDTAKNADYLKSTVVEKGHESITAHASATFYITGISRNCSHELIRHRFLAFSELSQRYVGQDDAELVLPPAIRDNIPATDDYKFDQKEMSYVLDDSKDTYRRAVNALESAGITGKAAREAARAALPGGIETKLVVSGNMRAWRDFLRQRWHVEADAEMRELAGAVLKELRIIAPSTFQDIPMEPFGTKKTVKTKTWMTTTAVVDEHHIWPNGPFQVKVTGANGVVSFRASEVEISPNIPDMTTAA